MIFRTEIPKENAAAAAISGTVTTRLGQSNERKAANRRDLKGVERTLRSASTEEKSDPIDCTADYDGSSSLAGGGSEQRFATSSSDTDFRDRNTDLESGVCCTVSNQVNHTRDKTEKES